MLYDHFSLWFLFFLFIFYIPILCELSRWQIPSFLLDIFVFSLALMCVVWIEILNYNWFALFRLFLNVHILVLKNNFISEIIKIKKIIYNAYGILSIKFNFLLFTFKLFFHVRIYMYGVGNSFSLFLHG